VGGSTYYVAIRSFKLFLYEYVNDEVVSLMRSFCSFVLTSAEWSLGARNMKGDGVRND